MSTLIALILSLSSGISRAEELVITHPSIEVLKLSHSRCETLLETKTALCEWKKTLEPDFKFATPVTQECSETKDHRFSITVKDCVPEFYKKIAIKKLEHEGPNCWGTTLSLHGAYPSPRFVWPEEMLYWLDSPACEKLSPSQEKQAGDIINIFSPEYRIENPTLANQTGAKFWEAVYPGRNSSLAYLPSHGYTGYDGLLHSVTYISPELAFGKDSPSRSDPFYFHSLAQVYGRPRSGESECQENQTLEPYLREYQNIPGRSSRSHCKYFSNAYRCQNIALYLENQPSTARIKDIAKQVSALKKIQSGLFSYLFTTQALQKSHELRLMQFAKELSANSFRELKLAPLNKTEEMWLTLEYFSAQGIIKSIQQLHEAPL